MTNRKYECLKGFNGHFEIALYVDKFEEVDEKYVNGEKAEMYCLESISCDD